MFPIFFYAILSVPVCALLIYLYLTWNHDYWRKRGVPTVEPVTVFGTFPNVIFQKRNRVFDIEDVYKKYKSQHSAVGVFITRQPQILILDPKLVHDVLVTNFKSFHDTITSSWVDDPKEDKYVSRNPFWSAGQVWKEKRSEAVLGLGQSKIKLSYPIWENTCERLKMFLRQKTSDDQAILDTKDLVYRFTADIMSDFIWGIDAGTFTQADKSSAIVEMATKWTTYAFQKPAYFERTTLAPFIRRLHKERFYPKDTDRFFAGIQQEAIELRKRQGDFSRPDFLNHLLQLSERKKLSLDDFTGHSLMVMMDGFDTSGVALMQSIYYLAKYARVQEKLRDEILGALKKTKNENKERLTFEELTSLAYLDQCVHESLRMVTVIPNFNRICVEPTSLEISPGKRVNIEPGVVAIIPTYSLHHDEEYFPEPYTFKPERFDNGAHLELTKQGIFLPFGDGPRICLGMRVGLLSVKAAIVEIFSKYQVSTCPLTPGEDQKNTTSFVLVPEGDVPLVYKRLSF